MLNNPEAIPNFQCGSIIANYLLKNDVPLLSRKGGKYYFADSVITRYYLKKAPFYIKTLVRLMNKNK